MIIKNIENILQKIKLSEEQYCEILFQSFDILDKSVSIINTDFQYIFINNEHYNLFNIPKNKIIGTYVSDYMDLDFFQEEVEPKLKKCLEGKEIKNYNKLPHKEGFKYLLSHYKPLIISEKIVGIVSFVEDITETEFLKERIKEEEIKWVESINAIDDFVLIINQNREIEAINNKGSELLKKNKSEIIGKKCYEVISFCEKSLNTCPLVDAEKEKNTVSEIKKIIKKNQYFDIKVTPIISENGEIKRFVEIQRDITEIKRREQELQDRNEEIAAQGEEYQTLAEELRQRNSEYKNINQKLQKSEDNFRHLFDLMLDAYALHEIICDQNGKPIDYKFLEINQTFENLTGLKKEQLIGKTVKEVLPATEDFWIENYGKVALTGEIYEFENYSQELNKYYSGKAYSPQYKQFVVVFNDVTDKKISEQILKQSSEIYENIQIGLHIYKLENIEDDKSLKLISANPAATQFTGTNNKKFVGKYIDEIFPYFRIHEIPQKFAEVVITQEPILIEKLRYKDNNVKEGIFTIKAFPLPDNKVGVAFENITIQFKYQEQLKKSEKFNKTLIECAAEGIIVYDENYNYLVWNNFMEILTGVKSEEIIGKNISYLFKKFNNEYIINFIEKAKNGQTVKTQDINITNIVNKQEQWINVTFSPHYDENDEIIGVVAIVHDITERKENEKYKDKINKELKIAKEKAEESDKLKTAFLANMSHEIRTPMNGIIGFSQMLINKNLSEEKRKVFSDVINESCEQLLGIVDDILDISKLETNQYQVFENQSNINDILSDLFTQYKSKAENIKFALNNGLNDCKCNVLIDDGKLRKILNNLLSNAFKFTSSGKIEFGYNLIQDQLQFFVKDSGIGISDKNKEIIFDRFRQVDFTLSRRYGGTGLGLSIVKGFVELLGGKIWFESAENKGSIFYFTLPFKSVNNEKFENQINKTEIDDEFSDYTILITEDEEINYFFLNEILSQKNINVLKAKNGIEAIDIVKQEKVDIILMDLKMPYLNGYDATIKIKEIKPEIYIIAQTAFAQDEDIAKAKLLGFDDYMSKPINEDLLFDKIRKYSKVKV